MPLGSDFALNTQQQESGNVGRLDRVCVEADAELKWRSSVEGASGEARQHPGAIPSPSMEATVS